MFKEDFKGDLEVELKGEIKGDIEGEIMGDVKGGLKGDFLWDFKENFKEDCKEDIKDNLVGDFDKKRTFLGLCRELPCSLYKTSHNESYEILNKDDKGSVGEGRASDGFFTNRQQQPHNREQTSFEDTQ